MSASEEINEPVFTPVNIETNQRMRLIVDREWLDNLRAGRGRKGVVTDMMTNQRYLVYGKDCGTGCVCDCWAVPL